MFKQGPVPKSFIDNNIKEEVTKDNEDDKNTAKLILPNEF